MKISHAFGLNSWRKFFIFLSKTVLLGNDRLLRLGSAFQTSGIRVGTPAITTRGLKEDEMEAIVEMIDVVLSDVNNEELIAETRKKVNAMMENRPLFAW